MTCSFCVIIIGCQKAIDQPITRSEIATAANNNIHGHLKQTKTHSSEVVVKWLDLQSRVLPTAQEEDSGLGFVPPRFYAYCGIALYESVVPGMPAYQSLSGQLTNMPLMLNTHPGMAYHWPTVANAALAYMTEKLLPNISAAKKSSIDSLETVLNSLYQVEVNESTFQRSAEFGKSIAEKLYVWSRTDGFYAEYPNYILPVGTGLWQPTPPGFLLPGSNAHNRHLRLFMPGVRNENTLSPPIPYSTQPSSEFFKSMREVYDASLILSLEQRTQANYWRGTPTGSAPAQWFNILRKIIADQGNEVMLDKAALVYCKMGIALADAAVSKFKEVFIYNQLRPVTYIRNVMGHGSWNSLFPSPSYPGYPDFHSTIAGSSAEILASMFGNNYQFNTNGTHHSGLPGYSFNSFNDAAMHAGLSRFYAGVNTLAFINGGLWLGNKTASYMESKIKFLK